METVAGETAAAVIEVAEAKIVEEAEGGAVAGELMIKLATKKN